MTTRAVASRETGGQLSQRPAAQSGNKAAAGVERSTTFLFYGYLLFVLIEYSGINRNLIPVLQTVRITTVLAYLLLLAVLARGDIGNLLRQRQSKIILVFIVFTTVSVVWAVVQTYAVQAIRPFIDNAAFFVVTWRLIDRRQRIDALSWTFVAVSFYVVARNIDKLGSATRTGGFLGAAFMGDGNDFAWALVTMLPIILNLVYGQRSWLTRAAGFAGATVCVIGIVGTSSRGAALGLGAMALYYLFRVTRHKLYVALVLVGILGVVVTLASDSYVDRMQSITDYQQDNSATARIQAWRAGVKMALDYPLGVGAGNFASAYGRFYIPEGEANAIGWGSGRWISAHSIYFKTLGEYGFIGLGLLLWLIIGNWRDNEAARKTLVANPDSSPVSPVWPGLVAMSVIGHAVSGAFLAPIIYPHLCFLSALTLGNKRFAAPFATARRDANSVKPFGR